MVLARLWGELRIVSGLIIYRASPGGVFGAARQEVLARERGFRLGGRDEAMGGARYAGHGWVVGLLGRAAGAPALVACDRLAPTCWMVGNHELASAGMGSEIRRACR